MRVCNIKVCTLCTLTLLGLMVIAFLMGLAATWNVRTTITVFFFYLRHCFFIQTAALYRQMQRKGHKWVLRYTLVHRSGQFTVFFKQSDGRMWWSDLLWLISELPPHLICHLKIALKNWIKLKIFVVKFGATFVSRKPVWSPVSLAGGDFLFESDTCVIPACCCDHTVEMC